MLTLLGDAEQAGAMLVTHTPVVAGKIKSDGFLLRTGGDDPFELRCRMLVNSAGLYAQELARCLEGFPAECVPPTFYAKGHYFTLSGRAPFQHLVYPMPDHAGLGIHVTLDLGGQCKFGPDVSGWPVSPTIRSRPDWRTSFTGQSAATTLIFRTTLSNQATLAFGPK
jgi:L-2-hydroxyglutarate oxidase LhgO